MHAIHRHWFIGAFGSGYLPINSSTLASTAAGLLGAISKKKRKRGGIFLFVRALCFGVPRRNHRGRLISRLRLRCPPFIGLGGRYVCLVGSIRLFLYHQGCVLMPLEVGERVCYGR